MQNTKNKFRIWVSRLKRFEDFDLSQSHKQFIGILDRNMREIYEGDVVQFDYFDGDKIAFGVVRYNNSSCAYEVDSNIGVIAIMYISLDSLEVVGNMVEDYMWDESGEKLVKIENL